MLFSIKHLSARKKESTVLFNLCLADEHFGEMYLIQIKYEVSPSLFLFWVSFCRLNCFSVYAVWPFGIFWPHNEPPKVFKKSFRRRTVFISFSSVRLFKPKTDIRAGLVSEARVDQITPRVHPRSLNLLLIYKFISSLAEQHNFRQL